MEYPLIIRGQEQGRLSVEQQGLFTVFEAHCKKQEGLLRLSVYGGGQEAYLGLMQPWSGGLYLKRKLSRSQLAAFPKCIEYAAAAGEKPPVKEERPEPPSAQREKPPAEEDAAWFRRSDGSLICRDGNSCIVALPTELRRSCKGTVIRQIKGQSYMLFRY